MVKRGRPRAVIDLEMVERLAHIQCTIEEISGVLKIPEGTLKKREDFTTTYKSAIKSGKASLRRMQWKLAEHSAGMAIWLGKQILGQTEKIEITNTELMREELEIIPNNGNYYYKSRLAQYVK